MKKYRNCNTLLHRNVRKNERKDEKEYSVTKVKLSIFKAIPAAVLNISIESSYN